MPFPKIEDAREFSSEELAEAVLATKRQLFELRLQKATRRLEKPHEFKHARHRLAQLLTVERERELADGAKAELASPVTQTPAPAPAPAPAQEEE